MARALRAVAREGLLRARYARTAWRTRSLSDARLALGWPSWNNHVYEACQRLSVRYPDIPVRAVEHYGQGGEDLIVLSLLEARAMELGADLRQRRYLEIGGNHPVATSASYLLSQRLGMTGVVVEANPALLEDLRKARPDASVLHGAVQTQDVASVRLWVPRLSEIGSLDPSFVAGWEGGRAGEPQPVEVPAVRVNEVVRRHLDGDAPVFLSIDVEGLDLPILQDFDFATYRPWVVQAEPSDAHIPGNSRHMIEHMHTVGYALTAKTPVNLIFSDARDQPGAGV